MTDPMNALRSFQEEFLLHHPELERAATDPNLRVHYDMAEGEMRVTYVKLEGTTVTAFVNLCPSDPISGSRCYSVGYAVAEAYRNQGRAKEIVAAAIAEVTHQIAITGQRVFYVEAVVGTDNQASQRVAAQVISNAPTQIIDQVSGLPALYYVRRIELPTDPPTSC